MKTISTQYLVAVLLLCAALPAATPARAQEARDYLPADFARYAPRNALQMLQQVSGFSIRDANGDRGFGQASANVLINGQRVSSKNGIQDELARYNADAVVRIEIRDASAYDVAGLSGLVANVVVQTGGISGQFSYSPEFRDHVTRPILRRGDISINGALGPVEYSLSAANQAYRGGAGGPTTIYNSALAITETREERWSSGGDRPTLNGKVTLRDWNGITANLGARWQGYFGALYYERGLRQGGGAADRDRFVDNEDDSEYLDFNGDVAFDLGPGELKLIGLNRTSHQPVSQQVVVDYRDATPTDGGRNLAVTDTLERVLRAEYRFAWGGDWQISAENAFNSLESVSRLFALSPSGFTEIPLPGGTGNVQEDRYDFSIAYSAALLDDLSLRVTAAAEQSTLQQVGAGGKTREFFRPKGQMLLTWQARKDTSIALRVERRVGQIGFGSFLASVNLNNSTANAGNPDLVPPQFWEADIEATHDMAAWGSTTFKVTLQQIEDIIDTIPIGATGESPGNLPSALRYYFDWRTTLNFDPLGWEGAKLTSRIQYQDSRVRDPLTGMIRPISDNMNLAAFFNLRWDIPATDWATGGFWEYYEQSYGYRLSEVGRQWEGPVWSGIFVEHKNIFGLVGRIQINNLFDADSTWNRTVHAGRRTDPVSFIEYRNRPIGHIFSFSISGKF